MRILNKSAFCFVILSFPIIVQAALSNDLAIFVNNAIKQLNESSLKVPYFEKAEVETVQSISKANGNELHLCWLKNDKGRVGYIAVAKRSGTFNIVAFSATTAVPDYFLKNLKINNVPDKQLNLSTAKQESFVEGVPLVATAKTIIGANPIEISEIASSLSSIFNYIQNEKKILFFGHTGFSDPEYTRRFLNDPNSAQYPNIPGWKSVEKEAREAFERENIIKGRELTIEERSKTLDRQHNIIKPIIRRRLLNPVNLRERFEVIQLERNTIENLTRTDLSSGMKDAIMFQLDYLDADKSNLKKNSQLFLQTRGRVANIETLPLDKMQNISLPVILIGSDNISAVLLGFLDIDGERFASIFFPNTGNPLKKSLSEKGRRIRKEQGIPEPNEKEEEEKIRESLEIIRKTEEQVRKSYEEKGLPVPEREKSAEDEFRERIERLKKSDENTFVVEDKKSEFPEGFENGIHIINCSTLSSWQVLSISDIQIGDNW